MGRTRVKTKKAATSSSTEKNPTIESLFEKAQTLLTRCDYDLAQKFAIRILERAPAHNEAKELLGITQLELGELEDARNVSMPFPVVSVLFEPYFLDLPIFTTSLLWRPGPTTTIGSSLFSTTE